MPWDGEAWKRALAALNAEAKTGFAALDDATADALLRSMQLGHLSGPLWSKTPPALFFAKRLLPDIVEAYYSHPTAWSEIGFGGPASPRGYVRMDTNRRDPWESAEAGSRNAAQKNKNVR